MPRKPSIPFEEKVAQSALDVIDTIGDGQADMLGPMPGSVNRSNKEDLQDWMWRDPRIDVNELIMGVAQNTVTPQGAKAIQNAVEQGWLSEEETATLGPAEAGMLALYPRRLPLMRTGRPDPEMQVRYSDQMERLKRRMLEEQAEPLPEGMLDGGGMDTGPSELGMAAGALPGPPGMLEEGGVPQPDAGSLASPQALTGNG